MHIYREHPHENLKIHAWSDSNFEFAPHWHTQLEIVCVLTETLEAQINGENFRLQEGDILLCGINDIHSYFNSTGRSLFIMITPSFIENSSKLLQNNQLKTHLIKAEQLDEKVKEIVDIIFKNYCNAREPKDEIYSLIFHGYAMALLGHLLTKLTYESGTQQIKLNMYDYMRNAFEYIDAHYCDNELSLEMIADHIGISACYFSRCFKTYSGYTLTEYINRRRILKAERMLKENTKSITEISMECGYGSLRNFNRVYKEITGTTPHEVRVNHYVWNDTRIKNHETTN